MIVFFSGFRSCVETMLGGLGPQRQERGNRQIVLKGFQANSYYWMFPRKVCSLHMQ